MGPQVEAFLGDPFSAWMNAFQVGVINLNSTAPITNNDTAVVAMDSVSGLNLLGNDMDPEFDTISIDGIVQPQHGRVFLNADYSIDYIPDFDYLGTDSFSYWATDGNGNYSSADVLITVIDDVIYRSGFNE